MSARSTANSATQAFVLLVARLGFAAILLGRAWWRWSIEGMGAQAARIAEFNIPQPELIAWGTVLLEGVGGAMLALGLLTRVVAALVAVENVVIMAIMKWSSGLYINDRGFEYNLALACLGLVFLAVGTRYAGLDAALFRKRRRADEDPGTDLYQPKLGSTEI